MIKNVIKTNAFISVTLDDGTVLFKDSPSEELFAQIMACKDDEDIIALFEEQPADGAQPVINDQMKSLVKNEISSDVLSIRGGSVVIPSISELTVPQDFAEAILAAEKSGDEDLLQTYLNFWTLISMNPDSRVRDNIFWFIRKWDIKITKSGLLICYRNADFKREGNFPKWFVDKVTHDYFRIRAQKKGPKNYYYPEYNVWGGDISELDEDEVELVKAQTPDECGKYNLAYLYEKVTAKEDTTVFTDHHSYTFDIRIGTPVSMPREKTDQDSNVSCSRGLHTASAQWLSQNYFGDTGLVCLVNPANIVAIPVIDNYGKMRCCEYLPIAVAEFGEDGHVKELVDTHGYEDGYILDYAGKINNEDLNEYTLNYIRTIGIDRDSIAAKIFEIAKRNQ